MNDLEVILQEIVAEIDLSSPDFIGDGFLDSFALMSLIGALEQSYHISIFDEEVEIQDYRSLESIKNLLRKRSKNLMDFIKFKDKIYTTRDLKEILQELEITQGDTLLVHTESFRFGIPLLPKAIFNQTLCQTLIESCGKRGNVILPTFTYSFCQNEPFDLLHSKSKVGNLGDSLLQLGGKRTSCPIFSCAVFGDLKEKLRDCKEVLGKESIFDKLLTQNAKF